MTNIRHLLHNLGITRCYKGLDYTVYAICLALEDEESLLTAVTKGIYMDTAEHFGCSWTAVERNLRTITARAWQANPALLQRLAGYPLTGTPTVSEFIEIIVSSILRMEQGA